MAAAKSSAMEDEHGAGLRDPAKKVAAAAQPEQPFLRRLGKLVDETLTPRMKDVLEVPRSLANIARMQEPRIELGADPGIAVVYYGFPRYFESKHQRPPSPSEPVPPVYDSLNFVLLLETLNDAYAKARECALSITDAVFLWETPVSVDVAMVRLVVQDLATLRALDVRRPFLQKDSLLRTFGTRLDGAAAQQEKRGRKRGRDDGSGDRPLSALSGLEVSDLAIDSAWSDNAMREHVADEMKCAGIPMTSDKSRELLDQLCQLYALLSVAIPPLSSQTPANKKRAFFSALGGKDGRGAEDAMRVVGPQEEERIVTHMHATGEDRFFGFCTHRLSSDQAVNIDPCLWRCVRWLSFKRPVAAHLLLSSRVIQIVLGVAEVGQAASSE